MSISTAKVNLDALPADEAAAIRAAEAEAEEFYGGIEAEETERARLHELRRICGLMWSNRNGAVNVATEALSATTLFSEAEQDSILIIAENLHHDANDRSAIDALRFINKVSRLHKTMVAGYYFDNFPVTEMLARHAA